jgi:hypothetical protein
VKVCGKLLVQRYPICSFYFCKTCIGSQECPTFATIIVTWMRLQALEDSGRGRVLVVDAGGSMRCAVLGDNLAAMGVKNGWSVRCNPSILEPCKLYVVQPFQVHKKLTCWVILFHLASFVSSLPFGVRQIMRVF